MAVVVGGSFGEYFLNYKMLNDSRQWNTKNYDYAVVNNKGEIGENAKNEVVGIDNSTALFVKQNKNGSYTTTGQFVEELENPIYQIRDRNGLAVNGYFVDQNTGDVYFRPEVEAAQTSSNIEAVGDTTIALNAGTTTDTIQVASVEGFTAGNTISITNSAGTIRTYYTIQSVNTGANTIKLTTNLAAAL
jgi:hypothetical protein